MVISPNRKRQHSHHNLVISHTRDTCMEWNRYFFQRSQHAFSWHEGPYGLFSCYKSVITSVLFCPWQIVEWVSHGWVESGSLARSIFHSIPANKSPTLFGNGWREGSRAACEKWWEMWASIPLVDSDSIHSTVVEMAFLFLHKCFWKYSAWLGIIILFALIICRRNGWNRRSWRNKSKGVSGRVGLEPEWWSSGVSYRYF